VFRRRRQLRPPLTVLVSLSVLFGAGCSTAPIGPAPVVAVGDADASDAGTADGSQEDSGPSPTLLLEGLLWFDRVPQAYSASDPRDPDTRDARLDYGATIRRPIRGARVELLDSAGYVLAETVSEDDGSYRFADWSGSATVKVRVHAEMLEPPVRVEDNTASDTVYRLESELVDATQQDLLDLHATSGWGGSSYTGARAAAPFAILDTLYTVTNALRAHRDFELPPLAVYWSPKNREVDGRVRRGRVGGTYWDDDINTIVLLGDENEDTEEFDEQVIVHEWAHYLFTVALGHRDDSLGGSHSDGEILDGRIAFEEGFANALPSMLLPNAPPYACTWGDGQSRGFFERQEPNLVDDPSPGWFSQTSVTTILWDLFDADAEPFDQVTLGFGPLWDVVVDHLTATDGIVTLFPFIHGLKMAHPDQAAAIDALLLHHGIDPVVDDYGTGQTGDGGFGGNLPIFHDLVPNQGPLTVTLRGDDDEDIFNKASANRFVRLVTAGGPVEIDVTSPHTVWLYVFEQGVDLEPDDDDADNAIIDTEPGVIYILNVRGRHQVAEEYPATVTVTAL